MNIVYLASHLPWPPDTGTRIRNLQMLRFLGERARLHLALVTPRPAFELPLRELRAAEVEFFDPRRYDVAGPARLGAWIERHLRFRPSTHRPALRAAVSAYLEGVGARAVIAFGTASAQFVDLDRKRAGTYYVFDETGTDHLRIASMIRTENDAVRKARLRWAFLLMRRYERRIAMRADCLLAVSPSEESYLRRATRTRVELVPCGANLDLVHYRPVAAENTTLLFCGDLVYPPNEDAVAYFLEQVFPAIVARHPQVRFVAVGRYRGTRLPALAADYPQVELSGYVEDMNEQWRRASIFVNSLRQGRGFITKVMDAATAGLAIVSTDFLVDDLGMVAGRDYLVAHDAQDFAAAVNRLLDDSREKARLSENARRFAENHPWSAALSPLDGVLRELGDESSC